MSLSAEQKAGLLYKHYLNVGSTRQNREFFEEAIKSSFIVRPDQLWKYSDQIPDGSDDTGGADAVTLIKNLKDGEYFTWAKSESEPTYNIVKRWIDLKLTKIDDGTDTSFLAADSSGNPIKNIIPFNYCGEIYNYTLKDANDKVIAFGVGDWTFDIYSGILTFYGKVPSSISHSTPPKLSFYQYVGGNGFRQDTYGFDGAILPIDNIQIDKGTTVLTASSETDGKSLYDYIISKADEVETDFVKTYGWDGADKNEGIALSFEKIIPLTYAASQDAVKGYDASADAEIGTLLSKKAADGLGANFNTIFASQGLDNGTYTITIKNNVATTKDSDGSVIQSTSVAGSTGDVYKVFVSSSGFVVLKRLTDAAATETLTVLVSTSNSTVSCLLLYWSTIDKQYMPFILKETSYYDFGFPVVVVNGKLPPSVALGTSSLSTFSDSITPEYYGPRTYTVTVALEDASHVKSADYIVKNKAGWYLNDILSNIKTAYTDADGNFNFTGTIFLRSGTYLIDSSIDFTDWKDAIITGEGDSTTIKSVSGAAFTVNQDSGIFELNHLTLSNISEIDCTTKATIFHSDITAPNTSVVISQETNSIFIRNCSFYDIKASSVSVPDTVTLSIAGTYAHDVTLDRCMTLLHGNVLNSLTISADGKNFIKGNIIAQLNSKSKEIYLEGNTIAAYNVPDAVRNQVPVGRTDDFTVTGSSSDTALKTSGLFPLYDKSDSQHLKFAEFARPFYYNSDKDIVELLYDSEVMMVNAEGKLTTCLTSDKIVMPDGTDFPRGDNSGLADKTYDSTNKITEVLKDLWKEKADLDSSGKVPLQQLPDSVAYGGLLFVGNWYFGTDGTGKYPAFSDINATFDKDTEVTQLQKGWFFIVSPAEDTTDSDSDNDTPVADQTAVDKTVFTAGDWVVYCGDGTDDTSNSSKSWTKIDRAYSDPTYSPLPAKANVPGETNKPWYWKNDKDAGALELGGNTIIQAFKKVNDRLRKLEPKKPAACKDVALELANSYSTITYHNIGSNGVLLAGTSTSYDSSKTTDYVIQTHIADGERTYKELIYFGDSALVTVTVDGTIVISAYKITSDTTTEKSDDNSIVTISAPTETMTYADHGNGFWTGFYVTVDNKSLTDGDHSVVVSVSDVTINGTAATQDASYAGQTSFKYNTLSPYFPKSLEIASTFTFYQSELNTLLSNEACSGIKGFDLSHWAAITSVIGDIKDVYYNSIAPAGRLLDLRVQINDSDDNLFCNRIDADKYVSFYTGTAGYHNLHVNNASIPITHKTNFILTQNDVLTVVATVYDMYGTGHDIDILSITGIRIDKTRELERVTSGLLANDSTYNVDTTSFGGTYDSSISCSSATISGNQLMKIGRVYNDEVIGEYQWPTGKYNVDYTSFAGEQIGTDYYAAACFSFTSDSGYLDNASGFTMKIDTVADEADKWTFDTLTDATENAKIQFCIVDTAGTKITSWLDCNTPNDGFTTPDITTFGSAAMYAGSSNALVKRVTFGHACYSGNLYIRIGIKKDSSLKFTGIEITEVV